MKFDTKIAVVLRDDLATWQQLNMTAFLVSGIASTVPDITGENYEDGSGRLYLPMFRQPVMVFGVTAEQLHETYARTGVQDIKLAIFTEDLFATGHDEANRAAVKAVTSDGLSLTGLALWGNKKIVDQITKGLTLHR